METKVGDDLNQTGLNEYMIEIEAPLKGSFLFIFFIQHLTILIYLSQDH